MNQQVSDFLELRRIRKVEYVVATVVQIVARAAYGTKRRVACFHTGKCDGFLRFSDVGLANRSLSGSSFSTGAFRTVGQVCFLVRGNQDIR